MVRQALREDVGAGDATTLATVPEKAVAAALMVAREPLVACGLPIAEAVFKEVSPAVSVERKTEDGQHAKKGQTLLRVRGPARAMLTAERSALNFVQRLSGRGDVDGAICRGGGGHARSHSGHAQNHARLAATRKIRRHLRRRNQPPLRTL